MKIDLSLIATREKLSELSKKESDLCGDVNEMEAKEAFELGFTNGYMKAFLTLQNMKIDIQAELVHTIKKKKEDKKNERHGGHPWPECQKFCRHYVAGKNSMFCHDCCGSDDWFEEKGGEE